MIAGWFALVVAWLGGAADAAVVAKTATLCVTASTAFADLAGDNWITNTDRPARGFKYEVVDAVATLSGYLGDDGCVVRTVFAQQANGTILLRVFSDAQLNGVNLESWSATSYLNTHQKLVVTWASISTGTGTSFTSNKNISSTDQRWTNLLVATMVFRLYDWNVGQGPPRDCCLSTAPSYDQDGTCPAPATGGYAPITTSIQLQVNANAAQACCQSSLEDGVPNDNDDPPGLQTGLSAPWKFAIAHELGHIIAGMRMGEKEWGMYPATAPMNACNGDIDLSGALFSLETRGEFTKEYMANALREGWGNAVSAVTWNGRSQDDCDFQVQYQRHDFDLDMVVDDDRAGTTMDGAYDCEGIFTLPGDPSIAAYVTAEGWLDDVEVADDDNIDLTQCTRTSSDVAEGINRATIADVTRMFWDLTTDQGLTPDQLSDLYAGMCPRDWDTTDPVFPLESNPYVRLWTSAEALNIDTELGNEDGHLVH